MMTTLSRSAPILERRQVLAGLAATALSACSGTTEAGLSTRSASEPDPLARFRLFADAAPDVWSRHLSPPTDASRPCVLALSGGGEDGAFGAGALVGWSVSGNRPEFDIVTGVSTGALIAPFAFLGRSHDNDLRHIFTKHDAQDIMKMRPVQALYSDALYDTKPLESLITGFTPPAFLRAIADRHASGARLFIVTSELETARASIWNMGEIASAGHYDLFRAIMRASAALPGLFSPVKLTYSAEGASHSESHIDGGVHMQFLAIPEFAYTSDAQKLLGGTLYLLINNRLKPAPTQVSRSAMAISQQALTTSGRATTLAAVNATTLFARTNGLDLSVAAIDPDAGVFYDPSDRFSSVYMNALYGHGFNRGVEGTLWNDD